MQVPSGAESGNMRGKAPRSTQETEETSSMTADIAYLTATELVALYRAKRLSPVEATEAALQRIEALDGKLNAFCLVDGEGALAAARQSEARWAKGAPQGLLDGVPASIKDILLTRGWPTLRGSKLSSREGKWDEDAPSVARLREHGAVLLGKTTTPEFGWKALGDSPLTGITRNPWSLDHTPGGSSAGAAAALAVGIGALALGTDGGGSVRVPCAFCGLPGLKATFGRVPAWPPSTMGLLANVGPMARSVADNALLLDVIAGADARDPYGLPPPTEKFRDAIGGSIKGVRIAFSATLGYARVDPEIAVAVAAAAQRFAELGAIVEEADPGFAAPREMFLTLWQAGAAKLLGGITPAERALLDPGLAASVEKGARFSAVDYAVADAARFELGHRMSLFHQRYDLLLTPSVAVPALPVGELLTDPTRESEWIDWTPFSYPFNITRQPAMSVPCGLTAKGLPIGLQLVGRLYEEALVLRAAYAFEQEHPFRRPPLG
jgi:aspartyl-tRNA(Asn)/glutamyl-tRNA(Gln) amidotransferase subunit A